MNWEHLIDAAKILGGTTGDAPPGRPRQVMLKRALSTAYYAMFHALCQSNADALIGASPRGSDAQTWLQTYRGLDHRQARDRLASYRTGGGSMFQSFASAFGNLQQHRLDADYNPRVIYVRSDVSDLIQRAETSIAAFCNAPAAQRRRLAVYLLLQRTRG